MYFPAFFPSVRPFDGRPVDLPVMTGREREIPLDLSIKTVRQTADSSADPEDFLLLDHRKFMGGFAGLGRHPSASLLDPALFRLPYRVENGAPCSALPPFCTSASTHPMMNTLLQRERCIAEAVNRAQPTTPFLDPSTLSLHLRSQREAATRSLYAPASALPPGYSMFTEFQLPSSEPRRPEEKGAFTSVRSGESKAFLAGTTLEAARYAEHLQQLREQHQQVKCTAACCAPIPSLPQTPTSSCACCLQAPSPLCSGSRMGLKEPKACNLLMPPALSMTLQPPRAPADVRISPFCSSDSIPPLYVPTTMWSPGLPPVSMASKIAAPAYSPAHKRKENVSSPRAAKDYPVLENKHFVPKMCDLSARVKEDHDVIVIDDHPPHIVRTEPSPPKIVEPLTIPAANKRPSMDMDVGLLPAKMPRLEAVRHPVVEVLAESRSPTGPPPLLPAVPKVEPFMVDSMVTPDEPAKLVVRLPKKMHSLLPRINGIPSDQTSVPPSPSPALAEAGVETPNQPVSDEEEKIVLKKLLTTGSPSPCDSPKPVKVAIKVRGGIVPKCPVKPNDDPAIVDKRQRAFDLYSDLSELDLQDRGTHKTVRLRDVESDVKPVKIKQEVPKEIEECATELRVEEPSDRSPLEPSPSPLREVKNKKKVRCRLFGRLYSADDDCEEKPLERRILSQLNLTWRQRRLLYNVRRRRFRSGLDMIAARRNHRKRAPKIKVTMEEEDEEEQETLSKVSSEAVTSGGQVVPPEMKRLMVNKALGETSLHRAARQCYPDVVLYCLESKCCDVNARDNAGYTPLHECCSRGHLEIARTLLQYGADVHASAAGGIRPLHDAVENDHVEVVRLLLSYGADPTIATYSGLSPLKLARSPLMCQFLRGFMADISGESDGGPVLPWLFYGSASCLEPGVSGFDVFDGVPSDSESDADACFLFEVSATPHLPTFRLPLPSSGSKAACNCLRLSDVLRQISHTKDDFRQRFPHIDVISLPRHEFEASATCSQLLTGTKLDSVREATPHEGPMVDIVRLDNHIRAVLGIETITLR